MKKKTAIILLFIIATVASALGLAACSSGPDYSGYTAVEFVFNYTGAADGGMFKNSPLPVVYYYDLAEGQTTKISSPEQINSANHSEIIRADYSIEGWYRQRVQTGDNPEDAEYSGKWDFDTDVVGKEGVTLYARWQKNINYSYVVCYIDEDGNEVELGTYNNMRQGEPFKDLFNYAKRRTGYTMLRYCDADGNTWDTSFTHPGGETDLAVKVYVEYIKGEYAIVSTASEFKNNFTAGKNIYLTDDIDLKGEEVYGGFGEANNGKQGGSFIGNNYTVKNFSVASGTGLRGMATNDDLINDSDLGGNRLLVVGLFGRLKNATVENVKFENVTLNVNTTLSSITKIIIAPVAVKAENSTITNVEFTGGYTVTRLPSNIAEQDIEIAEDMVHFRSEDDGSTVTGGAFNFTGKTEAADQVANLPALPIKKRV